jgi:hypothetical protein
MVLAFLQLTPPAAEVTFLVQFVYYLLQLLTILQMLGGKAPPIP